MHMLLQCSLINTKIQISIAAAAIKFHNNLNTRTLGGRIQDDRIPSQSLIKKGANKKQHINKYCVHNETNIVKKCKQ